jgi:hypothetical protein
MRGSRLIRQLVQLWKNLWGISRDTSDDSIRSPASGVSPDEALTVFVYQSNHVEKKLGCIRAHRLHPRRNPKNSRLEVSVCRSQTLSEAQVWNVCSAHFDPHVSSPATGRCVGPASAVFAVSLQFDPDGIPYPQHANIIGWEDIPGTPDDELKHYWMDKAQRIAPSFLHSVRPVAQG